MTIQQFQSKREVSQCCRVEMPGGTQCENCGSDGKNIAFTQLEKDELREWDIRISEMSDNNEEVKRS